MTNGDPEGRIFLSYTHDRFLYYPQYAVWAPVSVNVDNNGRCRSRYCKRVYNNGTVSVNVDSKGSDFSRYCQRLH